MTINGAFPFGPPSISGTTVTIDTALNTPPLITKMVRDLIVVQGGTVVERLFTNGGATTGGALLVEQQALGDEYTTRDVEAVEPAAEFPIVGGPRRIPKLYKVQKQ